MLVVFNKLFQQKNSIVYKKNRYKRVYEGLLVLPKRLSLHLWYVQVSVRASHTGAQSLTSDMFKYVITRFAEKSQV